MATARTVRELIESSLRVIGALGSEETLNSDDLAKGFMVFQDMISELGGSSSVIPGTTSEAITLVAAQASYTVGENGSPDLNTIRPEHIFNAFVRDSSSYDYEVEMISEARYNAELSKATSGRPRCAWYNPTAPNGTLYVYPTPSEVESLYIVSRKPFSESTATTQELLDDLGIPRNFHTALKWILAVELAEEYGKTPSQNTYARADRGMSKIVSLNVARNTHPADLELSSSLGRGTIMDS